MNEERNLLNLVDIVSSHTKLNPSLVKKFLHHFFKEIEKELVASSFVNIDGLGIFRIIKSIPADRILFLGKFNSEKEELTERQDTDIFNENSEGESISSFDSFVNNNSDSEYTQESKESIDLSLNSGSNFDIGNSVNFSFEDDNKSKELDEYLLEDYQSHEEEDESKRKKRSIVQIIILLLLTIAAVLFLLTNLYQKDDRGETIPPIVQYIPEYTVLNNDDSLNFISIKLESNADLTSLSKTFYGHEDFWGYIYQANIDDIHMQDPFIILNSKATVKIPRLTAEQQNIDSAKVLANNIFDNIRNRNQ